MTTLYSPGGIEYRVAEIEADEVVTYRQVEDEDGGTYDGDLGIFKTSALCVNPPKSKSHDEIAELQEARGVLTDQTMDVETVETLRLTINEAVRAHSSRYDDVKYKYVSTMLAQATALLPPKLLPEPPPAAAPGPYKKFEYPEKGKEPACKYWGFVTDAAGRCIAADIPDEPTAELLALSHSMKRLLDEELRECCDCPRTDAIKELFRDGVTCHQALGEKPKEADVTPGPFERWGYLIKDVNGIVIGMAYSSDSGVSGGEEIPDGIENAKLFGESWSKAKEAKAARDLLRRVRNVQCCDEDCRETRINEINAHLAEFPE